jgi:tetratricopeptide (TPR) repeat protein
VATTPEKLVEAQGLLGRMEPEKSAKLIAEVLHDEPDNIEAQYTLAVSQRLQRQWTTALGTIDEILRVKPTFGRAYQEIGYTQISLGHHQEARIAFESAIDSNPSLIGSWKSLAQLYRDAGSESQYRHAQEQVDFLNAQPTDLLTVRSYISEDRLPDAERLCRYFLRANKTHVEGMCLLAEIATRNHTYDDAEFLLESCVEFEPEHRNARMQYVNILLRTKKFPKAFDEASKLLEKFPDDRATIKALYASACTGIGKNEAAKRTYESLLKECPDNYFYPVSLAHVYKSDGNIDKAVELYQKAYEIKANHGDAHWSLANLKSYRFTDAEVERMKTVESAESTSHDDRIQVCFALGRAFEDRQQYEDSMRWYGNGNKLKKRHSHFHEKSLRVRVDYQIETFTREFFDSKQDLGFDAPDPIFVVGLPRAGSTLIEQILSSHSQVDGTMELHNILNLAKRLRGKSTDDDGKPRYPRILTDLDDSFFRRFGEQFINETRTYRDNAPYFVDKMPNNFFHIGLIKLVLPNAKIIDARRHPMACCFSGFTQLFGEGQNFSYSLTDIGSYYRQYVKLMNHWDQVLPGFVLRVQYEDVVNDLNAQVMRILEFCSLPFEGTCVEFYKTKRSIRTPSAEQVRQPIYQSGLEHWRHYEPWLAPLKKALGPLAVESDAIK